MPRPLSKFWSTLERVPDLCGVLDEWKSRVGDEFEHVARFLLETRQPAASISCRQSGCAAIREIRKWKGTYLSVCRNGCQTITLKRDDVLLHRLHVKTLADELADSLPLQSSDIEGVTGLASLWRFAEYHPAAGFRFPAYLTFTGEPEQLRVVVTNLIAQGEPFILLCATRAAVTGTTRDLAVNAQACVLELDRIIGAGSDRLTLLDWTSIPTELRAFHRQHVPDDKKQTEMAFFPTPPDARWEDVSIQFIDGETISVEVREAKGRYLFSEMGMLDGRSKKPTVQWGLLRGFADGRGIFDWTNNFATRNNQKRREILAKDLRRFFRIDEDPFVSEGQGWRAKFRVGHVE